MELDGKIWLPMGSTALTLPNPPALSVAIFPGNREMTVWESAFGICLWHLLIALAALSLSLPGPRVEIEAADAAC